MNYIVVQLSFQMNMVANSYVHIVSVNFHFTQNLMFCLCEICDFCGSECSYSGPVRYDVM